MKQIEEIIRNTTEEEQEKVDWTKAWSTKQKTQVMENEKVFAMSFSKVYGLLIAKAECKGRTREEVKKVTFWLTGYTAQQIDEFMDSEISYGDFFRQAPAMNPNREKITGVVCGVRVENIENPLMRDIRYLDKLVDELAKGKAMEKILRK